MKRKVDVQHHEDLTASRAGSTGARRHIPRWNSFILSSPTRVEGADDARATAYSVCGTRCGSRVLCVANGENPMCSRDVCKGVASAVASANEQGGKSAMSACEHGEAAKTTPAQQPTPVRFHDEAELHDCIQEAIDAGVLGKGEVGRIVDRYHSACSAGLPLAAKLGDTGYYMVWEVDNRIFPAGWAHVLYDLEGGAGAAARKKRKTEHRAVVCKAFNGGPCSEAKAGRQKVCIHTHIVALAVMASGYGDTAANSGATMSVDGKHLGDEHDDIFASARREFTKDRPSFNRKMFQLMKIQAVYLFPTKPDEHLPPDGPSLAKRFTCFEKMCARCGNTYEKLADQTAVAVYQGTTGMRVGRVCVEMRECATCRVRAWASDNWRTTGMMNFNNKLLVDIRILVGARESYTRGLPLQLIFEQRFQALKSNGRWMEDNPDLAVSISSGSWGKQLKECFFAFEALTDHPADYSSITEGHFLRLQTCDGCNKLATYNVHMDLLLQARQEMVIDMDLGAQQLKFSMMTPMVFGKRFQFVTKTPVNFSPHNRKSNIFRLGARGATPSPGSMESGAGLSSSTICASPAEGYKRLTTSILLCYKGKGGLNTFKGIAR